MKRQLQMSERCKSCGMSATACLCDAVPRIEVRTKVCLVIHHRELSRRSNTGLLAMRALLNSDVRVRGEQREALDLKELLTARYRSFLFYPSADAVELNEALVLQDSRPIQLLVPDGTWRQARKINSRHPELRDLPRVKISRPNRSVFQLRAQSKPERMATLQAIAEALGIIEGDRVREQLMKLYQTKIERTLKARGIILIESPG